MEEYNKQDWVSLDQPKILFGLHGTPLTKVCVTLWGKKLCGLFVVKSEAEAKQRIKKYFPGAVLEKAPEQTKPFCDQAMASLTQKVDLPFLLVGTPFQRSVWKALLKIPSGKTTTYAKLAATIKKPKAVRAVGTAVGANPLCFFVPCHRVLPKQGGIGNYGPGPALKEKVLRLEGAL
tara:strand:- start:57036 stop:57566 length:531 start_codon:yes stop_codon:yes gene_type:complete